MLIKIDNADHYTRQPSIGERRGYSDRNARTTVGEVVDELLKLT